MILFIFVLITTVEVVFQNILGFSFLHWSFGYLLRRLGKDQRFNPFPQNLWLVENRLANGVPRRVEPTINDNWIHYNNVPKKSFPVVQQKSTRKQRTSQKKQITNRPLRPPLELAQLCQMHPEALLVLLSCQTHQLKKYLNSDVNVCLFVRCLCTLSTAQFDTAKAKLLQIICTSKFMEALENYVAYIPHIYLDTSWERFYQDLLKFMESVIDLCPSTGADPLRKLFECLENKKITFSEEVFNRFIAIEEKYVNCVKEEEYKMQLKCPSSLMAKKDVLFPNNFRDVAIVPKKDDLFYKKAFIHKNVVAGAYKSVEDYLDVQFHLMREDFIAPLRDTVREYGSSQTRSQYSGARFYKNARILNYAIDNGVLILKLSYGDYISEDLTCVADDEEDTYKRFMYGSLLCLTCDHFATVLFCIVHDSDDINNGKISVVEVSGEPVSDEMFDKTYLLLESNNYFAPYHHILRALQSPSLATDFPFADYIVHVKDSEATPKYLSNFEEYEIFKGNKVKLDKSMSLSWSDESGLDITQYEAYIKALFRRFVIIQGPPGAGKTFIALKIASTILQNCYFNRNDFNPILVVCYTNHALDQFLEGLVKITNKVVRVGGQSKNENLEKYNLKTLRKPSEAKNQIKKRLVDNSRHIETFLRIFDSLQSKGHIFDLTKNAICFRFPFGAQIVRTWNLPFYLETFLSDFSHGKRPKLINWLLLCDRGEDERMSTSFQRVYPPSPKSDHYVFQFISCDISKMQISLESLHSDLNRSSPNLAITNEITIRQWELEYLKMRLSRGNRNYSKVDLRIVEVAQSYDPEERWSLYWEWLELVKADLLNQFSQAIKTNQTEKIIYDELSQAIDLDILRDKHVIGMTTTGAARLHSLLRGLRSPIVIVEEAAEVLESHVVASLTKDCEHLIMIGDHQQLRPQTAAYQMAKKYNLNISLFERMVKNGSHCYQLGVQHRMRPEIARLITPAIYKNLKNNANVEEYPNVKGVLKNLFFINHTIRENKFSQKRRSSSCMNDHEARFLLKLANYLIQQGYGPDEITILSTYTEQTLHLCSLRTCMPDLETVQICTLDGFQGNENRIILLSLVRSNPKGDIGFLNTDNRVCVALSRAREGFYIIGNMKMLKKKSPLWNSVNSTLTELNSIGPNMTLRCELHPETFTLVKKENDFNNVPAGGCRRICDTLMSCGHICKSYCHPTDRLHEQMKCEEKCLRIICDLNHKCPLTCLEECRPCEELIERCLPCGHEADIECHVDYLQYKCKFLIARELPLCHHQSITFCHEDMEDVSCEEPCMDMLACGHACALNCHSAIATSENHICSECSGLP